jgi:hypothetical protein
MKWTLVRRGQQDDDSSPYQGEGRWGIRISAITLHQPLLGKEGEQEVNLGQALEGRY